ncbi:MAG: hypothetical protein K1X51_17700 [Rhodospirillaceae bacterium]|nr:hypothetical protein [Rhodospirillaceae bacterium]
MTVLLIVSGVGVVVILGAAFAFPCPACRKRRERLRAAYAGWKARQKN